ncbi:Gfo/Idh/MocA family protein [Pseudonocardia alaniniphila]|uniref:Gfo/Idh/MocA family oxidoreductase n=1 Tax=Pseudonocardia alaniniphila TaxID=75291 RepID=A0ABS9T8B2_9PSEU|nr:Gfo/Idh/MocA family oxidoreductase [Pseudonocardia alaniniphila]MCH6164779.1 Gfo/Idh/MocA family oxidoreductase [Pseudonocardia alaniniphila]
MNDSVPHAPVRFAVVGCGVIGRLHAEVLAAGEDTALSVLVDTDPAAADAVADHVAGLFGDRPAVTTSLAEALARDDVDAVAVCVPSGAHAAVGVPVLESGRHLVVEKPLDVSVTAGRAVAEAAARRPGLVAAVISQHRFDPASVAVHEAVTRGELGRVTSAVATVSWWRSQGYYDSGDWRGTWDLDGGGALMNQGVHTVDLLLWFLGRPIDVVAHTALLAHERVEVEDTVAAVVRFESGALATLHATTAAYPGLTVRLQVMGDAGSAVVDNDRLYYFHSARRSSVEAAGDAGVGPNRGIGGDGNQAAQLVGPEESGQQVGGGPGTSAMFAGHERQYRDVLDAIRTGRAPGVTVADALLALATVQAVYESARTGATVAIADVLDGRIVPTPEPPRRPAAVS